MCGKKEDVPWIDMNWPNFNAAPLMRPRVETSRLIFASLINTLPPLFSPPFPAVDRRIDSDAAPHESDAASAATVVGNIPCQWLLGERAGTGGGGGAYSHSGKDGRVGKQVLWTHARLLGSLSIGC